MPTTKDKKRDELEKFFAIGDAYVDYAQSFPRLFEIAFIHPAEHKVGEYDELAWKILNESVENFVMLGLTPRGKRETAPPSWHGAPCMDLLPLLQIKVSRNQIYHFFEKL